MDLSGRSALVTGGAGGLGAATVRHLAGLGLHAAPDQRAVGAHAHLPGEHDEVAGAHGRRVRTGDRRRTRGGDRLDAHDGRSPSGPGASGVGIGALIDDFRGADA